MQGRHSHLEEQARDLQTEKDVLEKAQDSFQERSFLDESRIKELEAFNEEQTEQLNVHCNEERELAACKLQLQKELKDLKC